MPKIDRYKKNWLRKDLTEEERTRFNDQEIVDPDQMIKIF